jgi:hypothetical protein
VAVKGKKAQLADVDAGDVEVTVAFRNAAAGEGADLCASAVKPFRKVGRKQSVRYR